MPYHDTPFISGTLFYIINSRNPITFIVVLLKDQNLI